MSNGFNPLRWKCDERGCFNKLMRPKIEVFAEDLPGRIAMSDVDATVEVNGHFLFFEFKTAPAELPTGQRIYFQRLTRLSEKITVIVIHANAETMDCYGYCAIERGIIYPWDTCTLDSVKERLRNWVESTKTARAA